MEVSIKIRPEYYTNEGRHQQFAVTWCGPNGEQEAEFRVFSDDSVRVVWCSAFGMPSSMTLPTGSAYPSLKEAADDFVKKGFEWSGRKRV
jgi:hypothetical protein